MKGRSPRASREARARAPKRILLMFGNTGASGRDFLFGFARYCRRKPGWTLDLRRDPDAMPAFRREPGERYDGLVADATVLDEALAESGGGAIPAVVFGDAPAQGGPKSVFYVQTDNRAVGRFGARYLLSLGNFMSFAYVPAPDGRVWSEERGEGFAAALADSGRVCSTFRGDSLGGLREWLAALPRPAAVMCACDAIARAVVEACRSRRLKVPDEIAVLGVDDDETLCELESPSVSSIRPDHDAAGFAAAEALDRMLSGRLRRGARRHVSAEMSIVERESTAPIPPAARLIRAARRVIAKEAPRGIGVTEVARRVGVSRALLALRFRQFASASVRDEIESARLEAVRRKLVSTDLPVTAVAASCGYRGAAHLGAVFRRRFGMTMSECRAQAGGWR